jgi:hypothetical protein
MIPMEQDKAADKKVAEAHAEYKIPVIYLTPLYFGEKGIAERLKKLGSAKLSPLPKNAARQWTENLSEEQRSALEMALTHPISILTGAGTGKTTCLQSVDHRSQSAQAGVTCSPTGRAPATLRGNGSSCQHNHACWVFSYRRLQT